MSDEPADSLPALWAFIFQLIVPDCQFLVW